MKKITLLMMFVLACSWQVISQTLNQNAMWPNANWTVTGTYNADPLAFESDPTTTSNFAFDDDDAGNGNDDDIAAESPVIDLTTAFNAGETWLTITTDYVYYFLANDVLILQYWDADTSAWVDWGSVLSGNTTAVTDDFCTGTPVTYTSDVLSIAAFTATQQSGFKYRIYYNDDLNGDDWNYGFCFQSPTITSATPPSCPDPSALTASSITATTADLGWTESGSATMWDVEIVTSGATPSGTATATGVSNPYAATALTAQTSYDFYVRADCGGDGTSTWVGPFTFTTACTSTNAPYTENFETFTTGDVAFTSENCWTGTGGAYFWESAPGTDTGSGGTGPDPTITTGNYFYTEASSGVSGDTTDLISPLVDLSALTAPALTFNYHMFGNQIGTLDVLVNGTDNVWSLTGRQQASATDPWELAVIDLAAYTGQTISVTFRATSAGIFEGDIAMDNVVFGELPTCAAPTALNATNIDGFSADLGWTENGSATTWNIELVDITASGTPTGTATSTGVTNPYNLTGLTPSNNYEFYVQADCGGDGTSTWVGPFAFSTTVACPEPSSQTATNVLTTSADLGWTENGSATMWDVEIVAAGATATGTPTATGVANPYGASGLTENTSYDFYVRADCGGNGSSTWVGPFTFTTACAALAAPYTQDFETFTTATTAFTNENCWTGTGGAYFWESAPGSDTGSSDTGPDPTITTGNYFYTEASAGNSGDTTDLISPLVNLSALTAPALTFNYHMFGGQIGTLDVLVNGTDNVWSLTGQQQASATAPWELAVIDLAAYAGQTISVTFRATSGGTFEGDLAIDNVVFGEIPTCPAPNALTASNITDTTADLGWTENGSATAWDIEIVDITASGTATGTPTATGVTNPYSATGLAQNNNYEFYVRADCGGDTSAWVGPFSFTTLETCPAPSGLTATNIMETSADLGWTENGSATSWNIELVDITAGGTATGTATASGVTNPYNATSLVGDNSYEFYVQADCGGDGTSAWAGPFAFATPYVAVAPDCTNGTFLDTGGASGDYSVNENETFTICPDDNATETIAVTFTFFSAENNGSTGCWDGLTIHNGADASATTIDPPGGGTIWCWDRNDATPQGTGDLQGMTITSTDASGCLTFVFTSDTSVTRPGWEATVSCNPLSIDTFDTNGFAYYPNPVIDALSLRAINPIDNVTIYNMLGQTVLQTTPNSVDPDVDMSTLTAGAYFVKVSIGSSTKTVRVIKN